MFRIRAGYMGLPRSPKIEHNSSIGRRLSGGRLQASHAAIVDLSVERGDRGLMLLDALELTAGEAPERVALLAWPPAGSLALPILRRARALPDEALAPAPRAHNLDAH